jgi:hypothetical protein
MDMYAALAAGNEAAVEAVLARPCTDVNREPRETYRGRAWEFCQTEAILLRLLDAGLRPNGMTGFRDAPPAERRTLLHMAARCGWVRVIDRVAALGCVPVDHMADAEYTDGGTALHAAVRAQHPNAVEALVRHGADINAPFVRGGSVLAHELEYREPAEVPCAFVRRMVELGADADELLLHLGALTNDHVEVARTLLLPHMRARLPGNAEDYIRASTRWGSLLAIQFIVEDLALPLATVPGGTAHGVTVFDLLNVTRWARTPPEVTIAYLCDRGAPVTRRLLLSTAEHGQVHKGGARGRGGGLASQRIKVCPILAQVAAWESIMRAEGPQAAARLLARAPPHAELTPPLVHTAIAELARVSPDAAMALVDGLVAGDAGVLRWRGSPAGHPTTQCKPATFIAATEAPTLLLRMIAAGAEADIVLQATGSTHSDVVDACDTATDVVDILEGDPRTLVEVMAAGYAGFVAAPAALTDPLFVLAGMPYDATARHATNATWQHARRAAAVAQAVSWCMRDTSGAPMTWAFLHALLDGAAGPAWARRRAAIIHLFI